MKGLCRNSFKMPDIYPMDTDSNAKWNKLSRASQKLLFACIQQHGNGPLFDNNLMKVLCVFLQVVTPFKGFCAYLYQKTF
jgi:hypothetical protein